MTSNNTPTNVDAEIGLRIRKRREALGITRPDLAAALGISFTQIQKYEGGVNRVPAGRLGQIAKILQVDQAFFFADSSMRRRWAG